MALTRWGPMPDLALSSRLESSIIDAGYDDGILEVTVTCRARAESHERGGQTDPTRENFPHRALCWPTRISYRPDVAAAVMGHGA